MIFKILITAVAALLIFPSKTRANQFSQWYKIELEMISKFGLNSALANLVISENKLMKETLKSNGIHSKTTYCHTVSSNTTFKSDYEEYDKNGNIIKTAKFDKDGRITNISEFAYNCEDKLTEHTEYKSTGDIFSRQAYAYDQNANILEYCYYGEDNEPLYKHEYRYEKDKVEETYHSFHENTTGKNILKYEKGLLFQKSYSDKEDGEVIEKYIYDDKNNLLEINAFNSNGEVIFKWTYLYDLQNYPVMENFTNFKKNTTAARNFEYDKNHNITKQHSSFNNGFQRTSSVTVYSYNPNGDFVKTVYYSESKTTPDETFILDKNSLPIKYIEFDQNGRPIRHCKYEFRQFYSEKITIDPKLLLTEENIKAECVRNMRLIEGNMDLYSIEKGKMPVNINELIKEGYISKMPRCIKNGEYSAFFTEGVLNIRCSFHGNLY